MILEQYQLKVDKAYYFKLVAALAFANVIQMLRGPNESSTVKFLNCLRSRDKFKGKL